MRYLTLLAAAGALFSSVNAQTIADLIKANPNMTEIAKLIPSNPDWSVAAVNKTLFAPTDAAVRAAYPGGITTAPAPQGFLYLATKRIDPTTYKRYDVIQDAAGAISAVYDNYVEPPQVEVHLRTGTNEVVGMLGDVSSNTGGVLVGLNGVLAANLPPFETANTTTQTTIGGWASAIQAVGLSTYFATLKEHTFYVPTDTAFSSVLTTLSTLTPNQIAAILLYHVVPVRVNSVDLPTDNNITTLLGSPYSIRLRYGGEGTSTINDATLGIPGDIETTAGPIQIINKVLLPNGSIPPANIQLPAGVLAAAATTTTTSRTVAATSATSASTARAATSSAAASTTAAAPSAASTGTGTAKAGSAGKVVVGTSIVGIIAAGFAIAL
ncbi:hypothetical protein HDU93_000964 [Gonapodya sp. JEL0774]|nr:hypothetical protein HDU93_000964 [Gonapodya sp. JEL0774]